MKGAETYVMMETPAGVAMASDLERTSIAGVYFGLNDYAIATREFNIFLPLSNGVLQRAREAAPSKRFGFGGLTHPSLGYPLPCIMILDELERLGCQMTFLRRSFRRDLRHVSAADIAAGIADAWAHACERSARQRRQDFEALCRRVDQLGAQSFSR